MEFHDFDQLLASHDFSKLRAVISIGVFDGLHAGHQAIISRAHQEAALTDDAKTVVFTFAQNPKMMLYPHMSTMPLLSMRQAEQMYEQLGVDIVVVIDFSPDFSKLSGEQFIERCTQMFDVQAVVVGDNFRCGHRGETDPAGIAKYLKTLPAQPKVIVPTMYRLSDGTVDSSTIVRATIKDGKMGEIPQLLGRYYSLDLAHLPSRKNEWPLQIPIGSFMQLLPPPGTYEGHLLLSGSKERFLGSCCMSESHLSFSFTPEVNERIIQLVFRESQRYDRFEFVKEKAQTC